MTTALIACVLGVALAWLPLRRWYARHRYARCLRRIETLEIELGFRPSPYSVLNAKALNYMHGVSAIRSAAWNRPQLTPAQAANLAQRDLMSPSDLVEALRKVGFTDSDSDAVPSASRCASTSPIPHFGEWFEAQPEPLDEKPASVPHV